tara:strand:- start:98 stop:622 length:525 start_codon:yes stop_codon:yes gene_type:complete
MALENQPNNLNILSPISFRLSIQKFPNVNFWCQSVNIPDMTVTEVVMPTPFVDIPILGDKIEFGDLTVTILVDEDLVNFIEITNWMKAVGTPENFSQRTEYYSKTEGFNDNKVKELYSDATLHILTNNKNPNKEIKFRDLFPTTIGELMFDSTGENEAITTSITFQIRDYVINE